MSSLYFFNLSAIKKVGAIFRLLLVNKIMLPVSFLVPLHSWITSELKSVAVIYVSKVKSLIKWLVCFHPVAKSPVEDSDILVSQGLEHERNSVAEHLYLARLIKNHLVVEADI